MYMGIRVCILIFVVTIGCIERAGTIGKEAVYGEGV